MITTDPFALQAAVSSLASQLPGVTSRRSAGVPIIEETPLVNVGFPEQSLTEEFAVGEATANYMSTWEVPLECFAWGEDRVATLVNLAALVRSATNILNMNPTINSVAIMSRVEGGAPEDEGASAAIGFLLGYELTLAVDTYEGPE